MNMRIFALVVLAGLSAQVGAGDAAAGKALTVTCAACHGEDGNSVAPTFPKLAGQNERYLIKQINDIKYKRRPVASMIGQVDYLNDQQIADIAAYYASQTPSRGQAKSEDLALGAEIYRAGGPMLAGQHREYIASQLRKWRIGAENTLEENPEGRTNDGDARFMRDVALRLTDKEIDAVANFIAGLY